MTTRKLLWGMTWRGLVWGFVNSSIALAIFLVLLDIPDLGLTLLDPVRRDWFLNSQNNLAFYLARYAVIVQLLAGITGLIFGLPGGLILGIITRVFFARLGSNERYRGGIILYGSMFGLLGGFVIAKWLFGLPPYTFSHLLVSEVYMEHEPIFRVIVFGLSPFFLAFAISVSVAGRIARWYERESAKGIAQNVSPN